MSNGRDEDFLDSTAPSVDGSSPDRTDLAGEEPQVPLGSSDVFEVHEQAPPPPPEPGVRVLLFSDDRATRESVRAAVGRRPARDVRIESWQECATAAAVIEAADGRTADLFILDGEAAPYGGLGLCRQLKNEIYQCPPVLVLTGRPSDGWLASWSYADAAVPHPLDAAVLADAVAQLGRGVLAEQAADAPATGTGTGTAAHS